MAAPSVCSFRDYEQLERYEVEEEGSSSQSVVSSGARCLNFGSLRKFTEAVTKVLLCKRSDDLSFDFMFYLFRHAIAATYVVHTLLR